MIFTYEGRRIQFTNRKSGEPGWRIVRVIVRRFDAGFQRNPDLYIGSDRGNYWEPRCREIEEVTAPIVWVRDDG